MLSIKNKNIVKLQLINFYIKSFVLKYGSIIASMVQVNLQAR